MQKALTKTERIKQYLLTLMEENRLPEDGRLPTEAMLCKMFGVSRVPVQAAFNELQESRLIHRVKGSGSFVLPEGRQTPPEQKHGIIPFVMQENLSSAGFWEAVKGAEAYLKEQKYYLTVHYLHNDPAAERETIDSLVSHGMHSLLLAPDNNVKDNETYFSRLIQNGINLTFVDCIPMGVSGNQVASDNNLGGYLATKHLLDNGYRRIGVVNGSDLPNSSTSQRIDGYMLALAEAGLPYRPEYYYCINTITRENPSDNFQAAVDRLVRSFRTMPNPPDALFCTNDIMALTVYRSLQYHCFAIPQDMALIGFDNLPEIRSTAVPLSSVEQNFYDMGYLAAELCLENMKKPSKVCRHLYLPVKVNARQSTIRT